MIADIADNWNARAYGHNVRFAADLAADLVDWLDPQPGECVMDLGCGGGALTQVIADRGAHVMGVDAGPTLLDSVHECGIQTVLGDGQALDDVAGMRGVFNAVFSNAALHWMAFDPQAVINGVAARLQSGRRFVAEMGSAGNVAPIRDALRLEVQRLGINADNVVQWYFQTEKRYLEQLTDAGFSIERHTCFDRPTPLPGDVRDGLTTLAGPFVAAIESGWPRDAFVQDVRSRLVDTMQPPMAAGPRLTCGCGLSPEFRDTT